MSSAVLVTGAAGFAGSYLIESLVRDGATIVAWHRPGGHPPHAAAQTTWRAVDLLDFDTVQRAVEDARPAIVYHCAGAAHVGRSWDLSERTLAVNVRGTHFLLKAMSAADQHAKVMIASSGMIYKATSDRIREDDPLGPTNPYGVSKLAQEMLGRRASNQHLSVTIGRAFNHIGPRQDPSFAASGFARQIAEIELGLRSAEVIVGNLDARRDLIDVRDVTRAYRTIIDRGVSDRPYNICSGRAIAIGEILDMLRARARVPIRVRVDPDRFRPNDLPVLIGDGTRIREELGWSPTIPLAQTLDDLMAYWRSALGDARISTKN
ncbi:MAG: GDP-mannose 4,6-dehydratase [Blastocatellia bacterium]|nr:MAG: GDP-mannose 4,6-dehydratase [Blastocatellia bacterium]